ncbi:alpha/beta fold hydrolase [Frigoribacterium sp. CG_9.8]|uniref:alpha/beta fold hydrolase n=1 Tax=Frigoribacterium sp. CG_9.8 TaxID=2787733 RepID=UPI0018CA6FA8|nr:alpha/beta hydrolase [Frigoribacterium sp. CG_9.8]MBG6106920.1 pimeloyl-ACP methyl ester carboxylesterase [Frigoribacterium sp. CG_9.8]
MSAAAAAVAATGPTAQTVIVEGVPVHCTLAGSDPNGSDPVVLLPGVGGTTASDFEFLLPLLARTRRVLAVDLFYGAAEATGLDGLLDQLAGVLRQVLPGRTVILVGFSVGATVAAAFTARNPTAPNPTAPNPTAPNPTAPNHSVASLVLVTPVPRASNRHRMLAALRSDISVNHPEALRSLDLFSAYSSTFLQLNSPEPFLPGANTVAQLHLFATCDLTAVLPQITVPTLVVGCTKDDLAGVEAARLLFASLPDARYTEIDSGHAVFVERPAEILAIIREFVSHPVSHPAGSMLEAARP